jgi:hypothetical protein
MSIERFDLSDFQTPNSQNKLSFCLRHTFISALTDEEKAALTAGLLGIGSRFQSRWRSDRRNGKAEESKVECQ